MFDKKNLEKLIKDIDNGDFYLTEEKMYLNEYSCSCGKKHHVNTKHKFCYNCGANLEQELTSLRGKMNETLDLSFNTQVLKTFNVNNEHLILPTNINVREALKTLNQIKRPRLDIVKFMEVRDDIVENLKVFVNW